MSSRCSLDLLHMWLNENRMFVRLLWVPWTARRSTLNVCWKDWCWTWSSNTLATWCKLLTHGKRRWCWERLKAGGEGGDRGWDGGMASLTWWTWVWANSVRYWESGRPGVLQSMGSQSLTLLSNWITMMFIRKLLTNYPRKVLGPDIHRGILPSFKDQIVPEHHNVFRK